MLWKCSFYSRIFVQIGQDLQDKRLVGLWVGRAVRIISEHLWEVNDRIKLEVNMNIQLHEKNRDRCRNFTMECIIDFDKFDEIIGIEFINIKHLAGKKIFKGIDWKYIYQNYGINMSYDKEYDVCYLRFKHDDSYKQEPKDAILFVNEEGILTQIEIKI